MTTDEAKAALAGLHDNDQPELIAAADALAAMIAEVERLTTQYADCCEILTATQHVVDEQSARIAALTAIPEEVEGLCNNLVKSAKHLGEQGWNLAFMHMMEAAAALRAYAARESDRARVDAGVRARIEAYEGALTFYANPEVYNAHPHGPAFDRRDLSFLAQSALEPSLPDE